ncbi:MAG: hypothetical protein LRY39_00320 [Alphaproteobacteria bacterium]|nr:hypothetical protein [Alphaproteobacteria bacterium]
MKKTLPPVLYKNDLLLFQHLSRDLPISEELNDAIIELVRKFRPDEESAGAGIKDAFNKGTDGFRTAESLRAMVRGLALVRGDYAPDESHLRAVAVPVMGHRLGLASFSEEESKKAQYIDEVLNRTLG